MKKKILFVDDDRRRTEIYVEMLRMEGYDVTFAATVREAQMAFAQSRSDFDLIIHDIMIPYGGYVGEDSEHKKMRGISFLEEIRKLKSKNELPVVVFTVYGDQETKRRAFDAGCNEYVEKPCLPSELLEAVKRLLET